MAESNSNNSGFRSAQGISLSGGKPVYIDAPVGDNEQEQSKKASGSVITAEPQNASDSIYIDSIKNSDEDITEIHEHNSKKMSAKDRMQITVLAVLNAAVFFAVGIYLLIAGGDEFDKIKEEANFDPSTGYYNSSTAFDNELQVMLKGQQFPDGMLPRFMPLYSENTDTVGWIKIEDTSIDFPVLQANDNDKYHRANFYCEYDRRGSIFMDNRNKLGSGSGALSKNTIIYGHHLSQDECIFADVEKYMDAEYYKTHPVIEFDTLYDEYKWKVFSCFVTTVNGKHDNGYVFYYWDPNISDADTVPFANECISRSWFINPAIDIQSTDKLLCLSTCTYILNKNEYIEARCVLMARLVRSGESDSVDVTGAYQNTSKRMPQLWYDLNGTANPYAGGPYWKATS